MADRLPKPSTFSTKEEGWMETLNQMLAADEKKNLWLSFQSKPLSLSAKPYRLRFDKRTIRLYEPQQSPTQKESPELATVALPEPGIGHYYAATGKGETWLCLKFRLLRDGDAPADREAFAQLVIATCEELVTSPPSEIPHQSVQ